MIFLHKRKERSMAARHNTRKRAREGEGESIYPRLTKYTRDGQWTDLTKEQAACLIRYLGEETPLPYSAPVAQFWSVLDSYVAEGRPMPSLDEVDMAQVEFAFGKTPTKRTKRQDEDDGEGDATPDVADGEGDADGADAEGDPEADQAYEDGEDNGEGEGGAGNEGEGDGDDDEGDETVEIPDSKEEKKTAVAKAKAAAAAKAAKAAAAAAARAAAAAKVLAKKADDLAVAAKARAAAAKAEAKTEAEADAKA